MISLETTIEFISVNSIRAIIKKFSLPPNPHPLELSSGVLNIVFSIAVIVRDIDELTSFIVVILQQSSLSMTCQRNKYAYDHEEEETIKHTFLLSQNEERPSYRASLLTTSMAQVHVLVLAEAHKYQSL
jgi:hypothetical protein